MGRPRGRQHKLRYELESVRDKSFENRLRQLVRHKFGVCEAETVTVVAACLDHVRGAWPGVRDPLDVLVDLPVGRELRCKVATPRAGCRPVVLSPCAEHDLDLWLEQGTRAVQTARAVRVVEQTDRAGCTMPLAELVGLVHLGSRTITARLRGLWKRGLRLPVLGIPQSSTGVSCRMAEVLRGYVANDSPEKTRRRLLLSPRAYGNLLRKATWVSQGYAAGRTASELTERLDLSPAEVDSTLNVARRAEKTKHAQGRLRELLREELGPNGAGPRVDGFDALVSRSGFEAYLIRRHLFSPARAELLANAVAEAAHSRDGFDRAAGDIVFWAIGAQEPAGKTRADCELTATVLSFYVGDQDRVPRGRSTEMKVHKAVRFAAEARQQGGLLCLPDLAFLLGMDVRGLQRAITRSKLVVMTRGTVMDIGRGVTHRAQIVRLYVEGFTEPQIVRRSHHSYVAVASYIQEFSRVMLLVDRKLPPSHIRKLLGKSLKLVNEYIALYRQLNLDEHQWKLNLMRRAAVEQEKKRTPS